MTAAIERVDQDLTITINRSDLEMVMAGRTTFDDLIAAGKARFDGNREPFDRLRGMLVQFAPDFEMLPGTKPEAAPLAHDSLEQAEPGDTSGG